MTEPKVLLERASRHAPETRFDLGDIGQLRRRRERRRRIGAIGVGLGLTVLIVAGSLAGLRSSPAGDAPGARLAEPRREVPGLAAGQFSYQRIRYESNCDGCGNTIVALESWWAADDSGRIDVIQARHFGIDGGTFGPGEFPDEGDLSAFPTEPSALEAFLTERSGSDGASPRPDVTPAPDVSLEEGQLWLAIRDFLGSTQYLNTTPELRVAMLRVLADIPMVGVQPDSTDPLGRQATALVFQAYDAHHEVFIDPDTGDFLARTEQFADGSLSSLVVEAAGLTSSNRSIPREEMQTIAAAPRSSV